MKFGWAIIPSYFETQRSVFAAFVKKNKIPHYFESYSEFIKKMTKNDFFIIKWIQLQGFGEGRLIDLWKCVFSCDICIYISHIFFKISLYSWSWVEQREKKRKAMHTHAFFYKSNFNTKARFCLWLRNNSMINNNNNNKLQNKTKT